MKHLKLFNSENEYVAFKETSDFITPNVSFVIENNLVHFNAAPEAPQHDFAIWITDNYVSDNSFEEEWQAFITRYPNPGEVYAYQIGVYEADAVDYTGDSEIFNPSQSPKNEGNVLVVLSNPEAGRVSGLLSYSIGVRDFSDEEAGDYSFYECYVDNGNMILYTETDNINWQVGYCDPW